MNKIVLIKIYLLISAIVLSGCAGVNTFSSSARAGDTTVVAAGWQKNFSRDKITVTVTPSAGAPIIYLPGDPAVRAVINLYPDPLSSILVSTETNQDITPFATTYSSLINFHTSGDKDWWQTAVYIDLPAVMSTGVATIEISNDDGDYASSTVEVIDGVGSPEDFNANLNGPLTAMQLASLERVNHYEVVFSGSVLPYAIQVDMSHDLDVDNGGVGKAHVSNPRGDIKNILWNDDGSNLKVLLTPAKAQALPGFVDFKFYIAGGVTGLLLTDVLAVDASGNPVSGVIATINQN